MFARAAVGSGGSYERQVVGFGAAGGKKNFFVLNLQGFRYLFGGEGDVFLRINALGMHAGRIAVILEHDLCHKLRHLGINLGSGGVIKIYFFHLFTNSA